MSISLLIFWQPMTNTLLYSFYVVVCVLIAPLGHAVKIVEYR